MECEVLKPPGGRTSERCPQGPSERREGGAAGPSAITTHLILTAHLNDTITLRMPDGSQIEVTLERLDGFKSRLGFRAPASVVILRPALLPKIPPGQQLSRRSRLLGAMAPVDLSPISPGEKA